MNYTLTIVVLLLSGLAVSVTARKGYTLTGKIKGLEGKVYLVHGDGDKTSKDSVIVKNGTFRFEGTVIQPDLYVLQFENDKQRIVVFMENAQIVLSGSKDSLQSVHYTNAPLQKEYMQWVQAWRKVTAKAGALYQKSDAAEKEKDAVKKEALKKESAAGFDNLDKELYQAVDEFVKAHPASPVAAYVVYERFVGYPYPDNAAAMYAKLTPVAQESRYGQMIAKSQADAAKSAVGVIPVLVMADTSGNSFNLTQLRGKYVLVDFWASWCGSCRKENPNVVAAYKEFHEKGFDIVGVSLDNKKDAWMKAIEKDGLNWYHLSDLKGWNNKAVIEYGIKSVPTSFLLDKEGRIVAKNLRGDALFDKLKELLN